MDKVELYHKKIKLKNEIKYKKRRLAVLVNVPEALPEVLILKSEIDSLELELEKLQ